MSNIKDNLSSFKKDNCWARTCGSRGTLDNISSIYDLPQCSCPAKYTRIIEYKGNIQMGRVCKKHLKSVNTETIGFYNYSYEDYNPECVWLDGKPIGKPIDKPIIKLNPQ